MIKLVVTDMDQTLLGNDGLISQANIDAIKGLKEKGVTFGIASGRAESVLKIMMEQFGLADDVGLIIGYNGVTVNDEDILEHPHLYYLNKEIIHAVYHKYHKYPVTFVVHEHMNMHCNQESEFSKMELDLNGYTMKITEDFLGFIQKEFPKLMLVGSPEIINQLQAEMESERDESFNFFKSHENFMEVVAPNVSKGNILAQYCRSKGIGMNEVMAIGDNLNDLEMVKVAGYGIAVSNAVDEVKKAAMWISTSNNDNGVANAIHEFIK